MTNASPPRPAVRRSRSKTLFKGMGALLAGILIIVLVVPFLSYDVRAKAAATRLLPSHWLPSEPPNKLVVGFNEELGQEETRLALHISCDKPFYRPGETVHWRGVVLDAFDRSLPAAGGRAGSCEYEVVSPKGDVVKKDYCNGGVIGGGVNVDPAWPGGDYTMRVRVEGAALAERGFSVRVFRAPRLSIQVDFSQKGYSPGDEVVATVSAKRAEGGFPAGASVRCYANVDGQVVQVDAAGLLLSAQGTVTLTFVLPASLPRGDGSLTVAVEDGGVQESKIKTIPILLQAVDVDVYPEGGRLVAGMLNSVYFEASTPTGDPADIKGQVWRVDVGDDGQQAGGEAVGAFETTHEGRGRFSFSPAAGARYHLRVTAPEGISRPVPLPAVEDAGAVIVAPSGGVYDFDDVISFQVGAVCVDSQSDEAAAASRPSYPAHWGEPPEIQTKDYRELPGGYGMGSSTLANWIQGHMDKDAKDAAASSGPAAPVADSSVTCSQQKHTIQLWQRERQLGQLKFAADGNLHDATFTVPASARGVLRATVYRGDLPLAERLLFRHPDARKGLTVSVQQLEPAKSSDDDNNSNKNNDSQEQSPEIGEVVSDSVSASPGDRVRFRVQVQDERGDPVPGALVTASVTDDSVLASPEERLRAPRLPVMALLEHEMHHLKDAHIYLPRLHSPAPDTASSSAAADTVDDDIDTPATGSLELDLLLGTQGWRRFCYAATPDFLEQYGDLAKRALAIPLPPQRPRAMMMKARGGAAMMPGDVMFMEDGDVAMPMMAMAMEGGPAEMAMMDDAPDAIVEEAVFGMQEPPPDAIVEDEDELPAEDEDELPENNAPNMAGWAPPRAKRMAFPVPWFRGVYSHTHRKSTSRRDFTETLFWSVGSLTDDSGTVKDDVEFSLSDAITSFRLQVDVAGATGSLASADYLIQSKLPFHVEMKHPPVLTSGDKAVIPISLINNSPQPFQIKSSLDEYDKGVVSFPRHKENLSPVTLQPEERARQFLELEAGEGMRGQTLFTMRAASVSPDHADAVSSNVTVAPAGFPFRLTQGGLLSDGHPAKWDFTVPQNAGSIDVDVQIYLSPVGSLMSAVAALIRQPCGCFEQTSATTYPMVMAMQYMQTHSGTDEALVQKARALLEEGYTKLQSFETDTHGFEWFGGSPGHEALTAYGLAQFTEMAKVITVDPAMLTRTKEWLLSRRTASDDGDDGEPGFQRSAKALDTFGRAPTDITNAYITWALTGAGVSQDVDAQVKSVLSRALDMPSADPYFLALAAGIANNIGDAKTARALAGKLAELQADDGSIPGAATSITKSRGASLLIETSALSLLAMLPHVDLAAGSARAVKYLADSATGGSFGSTQATVLALKAIIEYDAARRAARKPGSVALYVNGSEEPDCKLDFTNDNLEALRLDVSSLEPGKEYSFELKQTGGSQLPWSAVVQYHTPLPPDSEACPLELKTVLDKRELEEGEGTKIHVGITNTDKEDQGMAVVVVGLPSGLTPRHEQLQELVRNAGNGIAFYETQGRDVVLYWRGLEADSKESFSLDVLAEYPGSYTGSASRAYLYYGDANDKVFVEGLSVDITPSS